MTKKTSKKRPASKALTHRTAKGAQAIAYSNEGFWEKVRASFRSIGELTLTQALILYHILQDPKTPVAARLTILGALAYLILPTDVIPDFLPAIGFTDDAGAIAAALAAVSSNITSSSKRNAARQAKKFFGNLAQIKPRRIH